MNQKTLIIEVSLKLLGLNFRTGLLDQESRKKIGRERVYRSNDYFRRGNVTNNGEKSEQLRGTQTRN